MPLRHASAGYQSWYGGLVGLLFKHWVHTSCCEANTNQGTPLSAKNFQEGGSNGSPILLRRSSRSRTLASCTLQHETIQQQVPGGTASASPTARRRRSHIVGNTEKLLSEIAAQVEGEELFHGCEDVPFEAQTERAVLGKSLFTHEMSFILLSCK